MEVWIVDQKHIVYCKPISNCRVMRITSRSYEVRYIQWAHMSTCLLQSASSRTMVLTNQNTALLSNHIAGINYQWHRGKESIPGYFPYMGHLMNKKWRLGEQYVMHLTILQQVISHHTRLKLQSFT